MQVQIQPIDLTALIPATLGVLIVLVPVIGFTVRFAIKPIVDALRRPGEGAPGREVEVLAARVRELEEEVMRLKNGEPYRMSLPAPNDALRSGRG